MTPNNATEKAPVFMATINHHGNVTARCPGCNGALSTFEWRSNMSGEHGVIQTTQNAQYRLFRCAGCGRGGLGAVTFNPSSSFPGINPRLEQFVPDVTERLPLPPTTPQGIQHEFREGEQCLDSGCFRAAAGMFRSVLDKTLRASGYKLKRGTRLEQQIDLAAGDGVITAARQRRAHEEIRVLGNDVLHDEWHAIPQEDVELARHYAHRILEDFYDDRTTTLQILRAAGRVPDEDRPEPEAHEGDTLDTLPQ